MSTFLQEDNGNSSLIRLIPLILVITSVILALLAVIFSSSIAAELSKVFLAATTGALITKVIQKPFEEAVEDYSVPTVH